MFNVPSSVTVNESLKAVLPSFTPSTSIWILRVHVSEPLVPVISNSIFDASSKFSDTPSFNLRLPSFTSKRSSLTETLVLLSTADTLPTTAPATFSAIWASVGRGASLVLKLMVPDQYIPSWPRISSPPRWYLALGPSASNRFPLTSMASTYMLRSVSALPS